MTRLVQNLPTLFLIGFLLFFKSAILAAPPAGVERSSRPVEELSQPSVPEELLITPVIDRPLGVDEGPSVTVEEFVLDGFRDLVEYDIHVAEVKRILEAQRQARNSQFTIGQLQLAADKVTGYYRRNGIILAQAFIPAQVVKSGRVRISILEGELESVTVEGNSRYKTEVLEQPLSHLVDELVTQKGVEHALFTLSDYPGLGFFGLFRPGERVGTTDFVLKVEQEEPWVASLGVNNHGSELTGSYRVFGEFTLNNPSGRGDQVYLRAQKNLDPSMGWFGEARYLFPVINPEYRVSLGYDRTDFDIGGEFSVLGFSGIASDLSLEIRRGFLRGRNRNLFGTFSFHRKSYQLNRFGQPQSEDELSVAALEFAFDNIDNLSSVQSGGITQGMIRYSHGFGGLFGALEAENDPNSSRTGGSGEQAGGEFDKLLVNLVRLQLLSPGKSLLFRVSGQYSDDLLVSLEQYALGGPDSIRAYSPTEYLVDKGYSFTAEYLVAAPGFSDKPAFSGRTWGEILQLSLFYDYGAGWRNDPLGSEEEFVNIAGVGIGANLTLPGEFESRLSIAYPLTADLPSNNREPQIYFNMRYYFRPN